MTRPTLFVSLTTLVLFFTWLVKDFRPREVEPLELGGEVSLTIDIVADTVIIADAETGRRLTVREPGEPSFLRGSLDAIRQQRDVAGGRDEDPWSFGIHPDGYPVLFDPASGTVIDVRAMGSNALDDFQSILQRSTEIAGAS